MTNDIVEIIIFGICLSLWNFKFGSKLALKHKVYWVWFCVVAGRDLIAGYKESATRDGVPPELIYYSHNSLLYIVGMDYLTCPIVFWLFIFFMR
jgi:hypothetical protein